MSSSELTPPIVASPISTEFDDGVLHVILDREDRLNAMNGAMLDDLTDLMRWAAVSPIARCVLISGKGRAFCVGDDLEGMGPRMGVESSEAECIDSYPRTVAEILRLRKPVVAALQGPVYGAGMELALACDIRVGDDTMRYGPVYTQHAFAAGTTLLPMFVGVPRARRMLILADPIPAADALSLGMLDELVEAGQSLSRAREIATKLAHGPTRSYGLVKSALLQGFGRGVFENLHAEENISYQADITSDADEGRQAFKERRSPSFTGT